MPRHSLFCCMHVSDHPRSTAPSAPARNALMVASRQRRYPSTCTARLSRSAKMPSTVVGAFVNCGNVGAAGGAGASAFGRERPVACAGNTDTMAHSTLKASSGAPRRVAEVIGRARVVAWTELDIAWQSSPNACEPRSDAAAPRRGSEVRLHGTSGRVRWDVHAPLLAQQQAHPRRVAVERRRHDAAGGERANNVAGAAVAAQRPHPRSHLLNHG